MSSPMFCVDPVKQVRYLPPNVLCGPSEAGKVSPPPMFCVDPVDQVGCLLPIALCGPSEAGKVDPSQCSVRAQWSR